MTGSPSVKWLHRWSVTYRLLSERRVIVKVDLSVEAEDLTLRRLAKRIDLNLRRVYIQEELVHLLYLIDCLTTKYKAS